MENFHWAILLKPIAAPIFMLTLVAPVAWVLFKLFPDGRLKVTLFKDRSGSDATCRDKVVMTVAGIGAYVVLILAGVIAYGP